MTAPPKIKSGLTIYRAFGLNIMSEIDLPELPVAQPGESGAPDVVVRLGAVEATLAGALEVEAGVHARPGLLLIDYPEARYLVRAGSEILVQPAPQASARDVRLYVLGSAMGAIFHQRGLLPLHANAIEIDGRAVAFAGHSGAGKSTLAAYFHRRGHRLLCDDVCVVTFDAQGRPLAWPGIPRIKLWGDTLAALDRDSADLERVWSDTDKFSLPTPAGFAGSSLPLSRIYILNEVVGDTGEITQLKGSQAADAVIANIYRWNFARALGVNRSQFVSAMTLLQAAPAYSVPRASGLEVLDDRVRELEKHCSS